MRSGQSRRDFLKLLGLGAVVFVSGGLVPGRAAGQDDFFFVQLSDTHWGFDNPQINPDFAGTLKKAVGLVNALPRQPDFVVFSGDLTHTTDDDAERRKRLAEFKQIASGLTVNNVHFIPGEHDAGLDQGEAFKEAFGPTYYTFAHKRVRFIMLDNVSDPHSALGQGQIDWLAAELAKLPRDTRIIVITHRPLFDLAPDWDWHTVDGSKAIDLLMPFQDVTVFYGHIHQEHHHATGHIEHHAAHGLMYPLPAPMSVPKKAPVPWDPAAPYKGLGFRGISAAKAKPEITEYPLQRS